MNYISPYNNPLQQSSELLYQIYSSSNPHQQQTTIQHNQDNIIHHQVSPFYFGSSCVNNLLPINLDKYNMDEEDHDHHNQTSSLLNNENTKKKIMIKRRDVERHRRQEMTNLYTSLRSLLPIEYIKGKRSISDHMNEATKYIKHLQKKIQVLTEKRDGLMKRMMMNMQPTYDDISRGISFPNHHDHQLQPDYVTVRLCWPGLEVVISNNLSTGGLALSRVLVVLVEEGLGVVSCASTRVNERSIHTIQSEVISDPTRINITELQQNLTNVVRYSNRIPMIVGTSTTTTTSYDIMS